MLCEVLCKDIMLGECSILLLPALPYIGEYFSNVLYRQMLTLSWCTRYIVSVPYYQPV